MSGGNDQAAPVHKSPYGGFTVGEFIAFLQARADLNAPLLVMSPIMGQPAEPISGIIVSTDRPDVIIVPGEDEGPMI